MVTATVVCQVILLVYHQTTTLFDLYPFNGVRNYTRSEKVAEAASNALLMSLAPIGFSLGVPALRTYGVIYYFVLFVIELIVWWIPYLFEPQGKVRRLYNLLLAVGTSDFRTGDTLSRWLAIHQRLHTGTVQVLPGRQGRIVPNVEHVVLHLWTLVTALVTLAAYRAR